MTSAHLETIFDVVKVVKVLQVSVTSLFQEVLLCLRSGLGMHNFLDVGDNFTMCSNNSDTVIVKCAIVFDGCMYAQFLHVVIVQCTGKKDDVTSFVSGLQYVESLMLYTSLSLLTLRNRLQILSKGN